MSENKQRVQDDLYDYVNHEWLEAAVIPDDKPTTGGFSDLSENVLETLTKDFNEMSKGKLQIPDENVGKAIRLFNIAKNVKKRNRDGIKPMLKVLKKVEKLTSISSVNRNIKELCLLDLLPISVGVDADMKDTTKHCVMISGQNVILPDTTYYKEEMKQQRDMLIGIWSDMTKKLLAFTPLSSEDQEVYLNDAIKFDAILATLVKSSEEWSEYTKAYNPTKTVRVGTLLKPLKFKKLLEELFGFVPETTIVQDPRFLKGFKTLFNEENFELYKHWAYIKELTGDASLLSEEIRNISSTYRNVLSGVAKTASIEKQAYEISSMLFSEPVGLYYGRKYFGEEAKKDVTEMVHEIINTYKKRMEANTFLAEETKQKAILKLDKMVVKMGYPDKCDEIYDKYNFEDKDSLFEAVSKIFMTRKLESFSKISKPVNREEWVMPGHMVNACYNPYTNDITFPAAILQAPFYSIKQSRSENLGGIGAVIGHEISHAFDNNGAQCDENGNLNNWWTKEDSKKFKAKTKAMIAQFDGIELEDGKVNGAFVVSENIADNGGMAVTLDIMSTMDNADYENYFYNWARVWCLKAKPEYRKLLLAVDVHSPAVLRANMQPRNFEEWYKTFDVKKTDKMYIAPNKRVVIW